GELAPQRAYHRSLPVRKAASMAATAALSSFLNRCPYVLGVTVGLAWPMRRLTATTSRPAAIRADTSVWRSAWNETRRHFLALQAERHSQLNWFGRVGMPSASLSSRVLSSGLPSPSASRNSRSCLRCSRSTAMALGGRETERRPFSVLGSLNRRPALVSSRE